MFPTPKPALSPNTYAYESTPLVKPTGFREYDARWLLEKEINLMGVQALGMGLGTLIRELGVKPEIVTGHDFRSYSASVKMALVSGLMAAGCKVHDIGLGDHADGLFRPVRARRALRRHGHRLAQRQRLDRREDGRQPAADLRPGRDDAPEGDRAGRAIRPQGRRRLRVRGEFPRPLHRRSHQAAEAQAQAQGGGRLRQRHRRRLRAANPAGGRLRGGAARLRSRPHLPALQSQHRRHEDAARHARRGAGQQGRCRRSASTATATAAASSTTKARRFSPTRSA